jgi:hypothetical protein
MHNNEFEALGFLIDFWCKCAEVFINTFVGATLGIIRYISNL